METLGIIILVAIIAIFVGVPVIKHLSNKEETNDNSVYQNGKDDKIKYGLPTPDIFKAEALGSQKVKLTWFYGDEADFFEAILIKNGTTSEILDLVYHNDNWGTLNQEKRAVWQSKGYISTNNVIQLRAVNRKTGEVSEWSPEFKV